jgi:MoxR-like ATPase
MDKKERQHMSEMQAVQETAQKMYDNIRQVIKGQDDVIKKVVAAFLTGGHVLLEDVPGSGKTMLAKTLAASIDGKFQRIQMTPDLLPADITGISIYDMQESKFRFVPGPVFTNILIADEINRATPKTQSGLLECMEEGQVSVDGVTYQLEQPFMVIATQNPVDTQGVFPLPEAQIDRFLVKLSMHVPDHDSIKDIFRTHIDRHVAEQVRPVVTLEEVCAAMKMVETVTVDDVVIDYAASIVEATREQEAVILGVSQRGGIALLRMAKCIAAINGRTYVLPDDIKYIAQDVLSHRMILKNNERIRRFSAEKLIQEILGSVAVPTEEMFQ